MAKQVSDFQNHYCTDFYKWSENKMKSIREIIPYFVSPAHEWFIYDDIYLPRN
jgi:hypothetical protein